MSGDRSIAPARVFTDGIFTFFDFGDRWDTSDLPAVYRVVDGVDTPVNTRIKGTMLIAESSGAFTLRNGQRTVCVRPDGFEPDGDYKPPARLGRAHGAGDAAPDHGAPSGVTMMISNASTGGGAPGGRALRVGLQRG